MTLPYVSPRQLLSLERRISSPMWYIDEQLWTFLTAALIAEKPHEYIQLFCGDTVSLPAVGRIVCEAEPLSTRSGSVEGNTVLDIAFGHVVPRALRAGDSATPQNTLAGIAYGAHANNSWVCFVEAKYLSDCGCKVTHDPLRNQLTRVIENLLCFQTDGQMPSRLYFALLTPRVFRDNPTARLYGYKMRDYADRDAIKTDIEACPLLRRTTRGYTFPDTTPRIGALVALRWVTFEDVLKQAGLGEELDVVSHATELGHIREEISSRLMAQRQQSS